METKHSMKLESRITHTIRQNAGLFARNKTTSIGVDRAGIDSTDIALAAAHYRALGWRTDTTGRYFVLTA
jgi:hypothetical protein